MADILNNQYLFDGRKAVAIDALPSSAWTWYSPSQSEDEQTIQERHKAVPWLYRAVDLRANAVASMPFAIMRGEEEIDNSGTYQNALGFLPYPVDLLYLVEASLTLGGQAYVFKDRAPQPEELRYLVASTIEPKFNEDGVVAFVRRIGNQEYVLDPENILYFWMRDSWIEAGPATATPAQAALASAGVLYHVDNFASEFFKRGAIKATVLTIEGASSKEERGKLKAWWQRVISGNPWVTSVVSKKVTPVQIGEGVSELSNAELIKEKREDISTALGIPQTLLFSNAANFATAQEDRLSFYRETIVPECRFIESALNTQLFEPLGLRWSFKPETLDVYQQDENQRAQAFKLYVDAGVNLGVAAEMLGIELPEGIEFGDLDAMRQERSQLMMERMQQSQPPQFSQQQDQEAERDTRRWRRKALAKGADASFHSDAIPEAEQDVIRQRLADAESREDIEKAFDMKVAHGPVLGANDPLLPLPNEIEFTDAEIDQALRRWNKLMPEYAGMLDAKPEGNIDIGERY